MKTKLPGQLSFPELMSERDRCDAHIRIVADASQAPNDGPGSILITFDPDSHPVLTDRGFADEIERVLGRKCNSDQTEVFAPMIWVDELDPLDPSEAELAAREDREQVGSGLFRGALGGYFGIRVENAEDAVFSPEDRAAVTAIIAERYEGDQTFRLLRDYTSQSEPIEIAGPDYNLASEITADHPTIDSVEQFVTEHRREAKIVETAPHVARVAFA